MEVVWWNKVGITVAAEVRDWPAMCWTIESLRARIGETQCHVRSRTGSAEYKEGKRYCIEQMTFARYADMLLAGDGGDYYLAIQVRSLTQHPCSYPYDLHRHDGCYLAIQNVQRVFAELVAELPTPSYVRKKHSGPFLWVASAGHYEFPPGLRTQGGRRAPLPSGFYPRFIATK